MKREEDLQDRPFSRDDELASLTARAIARNAADRKRIMTVLEKVAKEDCWNHTHVCTIDDNHVDMCASCLAQYLINGGS